jgi:RNA-directed DNA polymerase
MDRALQAMVKNALEPSWEARFEASSYGFRPGRGCHDALGKVYCLACPHRRKKWVVDADIKGAFDNIDHDFLLQALGEVPGKELVRQWLKAGVMEGGVFSVTEAGTPQGGVISPLLLNIALHGMELALGVPYGHKRRDAGKRACAVC